LQHNNNNLYKEMKKTLIFASIAGMACLVACGPSAEQKAAAEKAKADSVAAAHRQDSLAMVAKQMKMQDSLKNVQMKMAADSAAAAAKPAEGDKKDEKKGKK
jgi:hypothetical protein